MAEANTPMVSFGDALVARNIADELTDLQTILRAFPQQLAGHRHRSGPIWHPLILTRRLPVPTC